MNSVSKGVERVKHQRVYHIGVHDCGTWVYKGDKRALTLRLSGRYLRPSNQFVTSISVGFGPSSGNLSLS
jgi:hypothetical protein